MLQTAALNPDRSFYYCSAQNESCAHSSMLSWKLAGTDRTSTMLQQYVEILGEIYALSSILVENKRTVNEGVYVNTVKNYF